MLSPFTWAIVLPLMVTIHAFARSRHTQSRGVADRWFGGVVVALAMSTLLMIGLLSFRLFSPRSLLISHLALALIISYVSQPSRRFVRPQQYRRLPCAVALLIFFVAVGFRVKPASHLYGGQDPGVYTNAGNYIAQHGTRFYTDTTIPIVREDPNLLKYYLSSTYLHTNQNADGSWFGNLFGGLYIHDLTRGESVFQFYPATETWLALGALLFGPHESTWIFLPFSLLTVLVVGLITYRLTKSSIAGFSASALLAINPAHAAISTSPLSEALACFFFLTGTYFLISAFDRERRSVSKHALTLSALAFGALFFTRITGFLTLPLILVAVLGMATVIPIRRGRVALMLYGMSCSGLYLASFAWGLTFSYPYSRDIFESKLGISASSLTYLPYMLIVGVIVWAFLVWALSWTGIHRILRKGRNSLGWIVIGVLICVIAWKGYQLGFTDTYAEHRWFSKRWKIAGKGWRSVISMSISALSLIMSPPGLLIGLCGVALTVRRALTTSTWIPLCVLTTGFLVVLTLKPLTVPYLYYFARYQVSELLPLLIITGSCFVHHLTCRTNRPVQLIASFAFFTSCALFLVRPAVARLQETEGLLFSRAMACIDSLTPGNTIIALDKADLLVSPVVTPLRLTYNKKTVGFKKSHFPDDAALRAFFEFFARRGYDVVVLSASERWSSYPWFTKVIRIPTRMRKLGAPRGQYRLPDQYSGGIYPVRVYRYFPEGTTREPGKTNLPVACRDIDQSTTR